MKGSSSTFSDKIASNKSLQLHQTPQSSKCLPGLSINQEPESMSTYTHEWSFQILKIQIQVGGPKKKKKEQVKKNKRIIEPSQKEKYETWTVT